MCGVYKLIKKRFMKFLLKAHLGKRTNGVAVDSERNVGWFWWSLRIDSVDRHIAVFG